MFASPILALLFSGATSALPAEPATSPQQALIHIYSLPNFAGDTAQVVVAPNICTDLRHIYGNGKPVMSMSSADDVSCKFYPTWNCTKPNNEQPWVLKARPDLSDWEAFPVGLRCGVGEWKETDAFNTSCELFGNAKLWPCDGT